MSNNLFVALATIILLSARVPVSKSNQFSIQQPQPKIGLRVGNAAPDFELPLPDGQMFSLKSLRGKIVLIDFWASWCKGCRSVSPAVVSIYKEFSNKEFKDASGFTVLSVSMDRSKESWLKAIEEDGLIWNTHVCDFKMQKSSPIILYSIKGLPRCFLIDGNGVIIARDIGVKELKERLTTLLKK